MDHRRMDRVGLLSPLEESSAEISRDSGIVSQSASSLSMVSDILSSGTVSQSPSFGAAANVVASPSPSLHEATSASQRGSEGHDNDDLVHTAFAYSSYVKATAGEEIRSDTSQIVSENIPQIQQKSEEIRQLYRRIDQLEGFVKMVGANVGAMEEQLTQAEGELSTLPGAFKKIFRTISVPSFLNKPNSPRRTAPHQQHQEIPRVFCTDDYIITSQQAEQ
ncbi:biogenesis of lysosome-related organelles complex 1 subunit 4 isoform X2 [Hippocampus zosterae]|uniref:biogenesis of lysosome-related organelles complex 1 subunit 4 isoform X2 n=1 Tax=Hippocampus zosterae TaxID=109293 RepID=UPI00223CE4FD|nr:biogenesis of lysosome-related organelles complex 1 subunit 4 isoform X2 [Hippocampus zosterae]